MKKNIFQEMRGKVAIITGATSSIGHETALLFAQQGIKVILAGRNEKVGYSLQNEITEAGGKALFIKTEISDHESVKTLIKTTEQKFGAIHFALNNAGIEGKLGLLADMEERDYDEVLGINLKGMWLCLKFQLQAMAESGGAIVNISTNLTRMGMPTTGLYTASKAGVESLSRVAAIEYGKIGIRVNVISPGAVNTPMLRRIYSKDDLKKLSEGNPLKNIAHPKDIASTALWLCSSMSNHINGETIFIDGGSSLAG